MIRPSRSQYEECMEGTTTPKAHWRKFQKNLKAMTLLNQDVAAFLDDDESFFLDLPFLEGVLPSMQAGEEFFVPVFLQKILLPCWNGQVLSKFERAIVKLALPNVYAAMVDYLETVFLAAILQMEEFSLEATVIAKDITIDRLSWFIHDFFGVHLFGKMHVSSWTESWLKMTIGMNLGKLPSLLMIAKQWGLDEVRIATNIMQMGCLDDVPADARAGIFVKLISKGRNTSFSYLKFPTLRSIAWTMAPEYAFKVDPKGLFKIVSPVDKFEMRPAHSRLSPLDRAPSLKWLVQALEARVVQRNPAYISVLPPVDQPKKALISSSSSNQKTSSPKRPRHPRNRTGKLAGKEPKRATGKDTAKESDASNIWEEDPTRFAHAHEPRPLSSYAPLCPEHSLNAYSPLPFSGGRQTVMPINGPATPDPDSVGSEIMTDHLAGSGPERSDALPPSSSQPSLPLRDGNEAAQFNVISGKEEAQEDEEDKFNWMLMESPLNLSEDAYGLQFGEDSFADHLDPDPFADDDFGLHFPFD